MTMTAKANPKLIARKRAMPEQFTYPLALKKGDNVALIAPSGFITAEQAEKAVLNLKNLGLKVTHRPDITHRWGNMAGTDRRRLDELHEAFDNTSIHGVFCARGGYGLTRLLPDINYDLFARNPKVFAGFSDITALLNTLTARTGIVTFHAPMGTSRMTAPTVEGIKNLLFHPPHPNIQISPSVPLPIAPGTAQGRLAGGNLSLTAALQGTPFEIDFTNRIVFLEEIGEEPYRIDRLLTQLLQSSTFLRAAGIVLGQFTRCEASKPEESFTVEQVLAERLGSIGIPVMGGFSFGHVSDNISLPLGAEAQLDTDNQLLTFRHQAVQ